MSTMREECPVPSGSSLYGCTVRFVFHETKINKDDNVFVVGFAFTPLPHPPPPIPSNLHVR
jgi:hypothetical protein